MSEHLQKRFNAKGPKRVLSLDGGGVMSLITLGYLEKIEETLRNRRPPSTKDAFRLSDYFDLIGGTASGAVIASLLALGLKASEIKRHYLELCPRVFNPKRWGRIRSSYSAAALDRELRRILRSVARDEGAPGHDFPLESELFHTGLAIFAKRIDTDQVWMQSNIPNRRFWDPETEPFATTEKTRGETAAGFFPNRRYRLKEVLRASAAPPTSLPPALIPLDDATGLFNRNWGAFIDGGASLHNNPCKALFLLAALKGYPNRERGEEAPASPFGLGWEVGPERLLIISVGAGHVDRSRPSWRYRFSGADGLGTQALRSMINNGSQDAVMWLQALSEPLEPWRVDDTLQDMRNLRVVDRPLLSFQRYQPRLTKEALAEMMGAEWIRDNVRDDIGKEIGRLDNSDRRNLHRLDEIGVEAASKDVRVDHLPLIFDR